MKYQVLFPQENNEKVFMIVVCCSCDCTLRVNPCVRSIPSHASLQRVYSWIRRDFEIN